MTPRKIVIILLAVILGVALFIAVIKLKNVF